MIRPSWANTLRTAEIDCYEISEKLGDKVQKGTNEALAEAATLRALVGELVEALHNASVLVKILGNGDSELTAEWDSLTTKAKEQAK